MHLVGSVGILIGRLALSGAFLLILLMPAWWLSGRIQEARTSPFFRFLCALGLALIGYISGVNLLGRLAANSIAAVLIYLTLNLLAAVILYLRSPAEFRLTLLISTWRAWAGPVLLAVALGFPQWLLAVSTNYWDEAVCSAIHLTAPNQFSEGVFPPHHNALPNVPIKYHYAFIILSGTVRWLSGLSANVSIDLASTGLWLFIFLFTYFWLRELKFDRLPATWGSFAVLLGGGLSWLYVRRLETYNGWDKVPPPSALSHRFDATKSWIENLVASGRVPSMHLRNSDGSLSNLPWDVAAQFQQHAVSVGIALTLVALFLLVNWQKKKDLHVPLLIANVVTFAVLFLGNAVFGVVAAATAGLCLLGAWVRQRTRVTLFRGLLFAPGLAVLALLHGGMLSRGPEYGSSGFTTLRRGFGYAVGGVSGFLHWNLAGFGLPLLLAIVAWCLHRRWRDPKAVERNLLFSALTVFAVFSYLVPQVMYYSSETYGPEQFTEISKFFFCAHFGLALLSAFGAAYLLRSLPWVVLLPGFVASAIAPVTFCYAASFKATGAWLGFYHSPYYPRSIEEQMGKALGRLKHGPRDVYFDASRDERVHNYLSEMLIFAGSAFTMTPSGFERTGVGFRLAEKVVADRYVQNGRMARLLPGAAEASGCNWYYSRPLEDLALAPLIVRSRFEKLLHEGAFVEKFRAGARVLYRIEKPTAGLDRDIELYWRPRIVSQAKTDWDGDGKSDLIFYDVASKKILIGRDTIALPPWLQGEFVHLYVASFPGNPRVDFLFGRTDDTIFHLGTKIEQNVEYDGWQWTYRDSYSGVWQNEYQHWFWDSDLPYIADLDADGFDSHFAYRPHTGEWLLAPYRKLSGPSANEKDLPVPLGGRFLRGSKGDLGLWCLKTGMVMLQSVSSGQKVTFRWGGRPGDVLVPGDYDGDGYDEIAVWQQTNRTWYWRHAPEGPISQATFGTVTGVPLPADYNHDGRLDLAYWEPGEGKIYVSYNLGRSVDLTIPVPPHSIPAFVNMY